MCFGECDGVLKSGIASLIGGGLALQRENSKDCERPVQRFVSGNNYESRVTRKSSSRGNLWQSELRYLVRVRVGVTRESLIMNILNFRLHENFDVHCRMQRWRGPAHVEKPPIRVTNNKAHKWFSPEANITLKFYIHK